MGRGGVETTDQTCGEVCLEKCSVLFQAQLMDLHTLSIEEVCVSANCSDELFCLTSVLFKCTV